MLGLNIGRLFLPGLVRICLLAGRIGFLNELLRVVKYAYVDTFSCSRIRVGLSCPGFCDKTLTIGLYTKHRQI